MIWVESEDNDWPCEAINDNGTPCDNGQCIELDPFPNWGWPPRTLCLEHAYLAENYEEQL